MYKYTSISTNTCAISAIVYVSVNTFHSSLITLLLIYSYHNIDSNNAGTCTLYFTAGAHSDWEYARKHNCFGTLCAATNQCYG